LKISSGRVLNKNISVKLMDNSEQMWHDIELIETENGPQRLTYEEALKLANNSLICSEKNKIVKGGDGTKYYLGPHETEFEICENCELIHGTQIEDCDEILELLSPK
jgi:hypothetical protein